MRNMSLSAFLVNFILFLIRAYNKYVQNFLLSHQHLAVENVNVFNKDKFKSKQIYLDYGVCTEEPNSYLEGLDLVPLRETYKALDIDLKKKGFLGIENMSKAAFEIAEQMIFLGVASELSQKIKITKDSAIF